MAAAQGEAKKVVAVDLDEVAVQQTRENAKANKLKFQTEHGDAFDWLRDIDDGEYDLVVLDPPKWVRGKTELATGLDKYSDLNRLALKKLPRGGILVTNSCSGAVSPSRFHGILAEAAAKAGRDARVLFAGGAGPDHPVALECPETQYLETVILEVR
jgi:23S rRNA (cytosine1962-C5)-methyltransferase